jgi:hypothetical protein
VVLVRVMGMKHQEQVSPQSNGVSGVDAESKPCLFKPDFQLCANSVNSVTLR